ncbi:MAG: hypothetical protein KDK78_11455, partial [Chlamydiia bacterium]|nr:hypothetical protein [Chlamydiia bacterium]
MGVTRFATISLGDQHKAIRIKADKSVANGLEGKIKQAVQTLDFNNIDSRTTLHLERRRGRVTCFTKANAKQALSSEPIAKDLTVKVSSLTPVRRIRGETEIEAFRHKVRLQFGIKEESGFLFHCLVRPMAWLQRVLSTRSPDNATLPGAMNRSYQILRRQGNTKLADKLKIGLDLSRGWKYNPNQAANEAAAAIATSFRDADDGLIAMIPGGYWHETRFHPI